MPAPLKSVQKCKTYLPVPKLGRNVPLPDIRPVCPSTDTEAFPARVPARSFRSMVMTGLLTVPVEVVFRGNVKRYSAVCAVTVASPRMPSARVIVK